MQLSDGTSSKAAVRASQCKRHEQKQLQLTRNSSTYRYEASDADKSNNGWI